MSTPQFHSPHPSDHETNHQSDVVFPQIQETLSHIIQPDPETRPIKNPDQEQENKAQETEISQENGLIPSEMPQSLSDRHVSDLGLKTKNWKKGKGKGKSNAKKQQMFEKKMQSLMENLNIIPFIPHKILDFSKHEVLLRKLGLWDFVNVEFDRNLRKDLIAQLVVSYESRASYVNGYRIGVNRAELARAFKIPKKKDRGNVGGVVMDLDFEPLSENSIDFMVEFVSDWVLRHGDTWMMPVEVMNCMNVIKDGNPEKVDWAGIIWFMVEKELIQGENLRECYYASHLQYLMKEQKVFLREEADGKLVEMNEDVEEGEENVDDVGTFQEEEMNAEIGGQNVDAFTFQEEEMNTEIGGQNVNAFTFQEEEMNTEIGGQNVDAFTFQEEEMNTEIEVPSVELTLGQDDAEKDEEVMDVESREESEEEGVNEQEQWLTNRKNGMGGHYLQRCNSVRGNGIGDTLNGGLEELEEVEFVEDDEEAEDRNDVFPTDALVGEGLTDNFFRGMDMNQMAFGSQDQEIDMQVMDPGPSFLNGSGKRAIEQDNVMFNHSLNHDSNKRMRMNVFTDPNPVNSGTCMGYIQQMVEQASSLYVEKEQEFEEANLARQILMGELQKRDDMIEMLNKTRIEEMQKKDDKIYRYEKELHVMGNMLTSYRKAVKERQKAFDEYREKVKLPEEPAYKDVGGGLMLSTGEIARIRKKQEEEFQMNCLIIQQSMKEAEKNYVRQFDAFYEKVNMMDKNLTRLDADAKEIIGLFAKRKVLTTEENMLECSEAVNNDEKVHVVDNEEKVLAVDNEEKVLAVDNEEKVPEVAPQASA